MVLVGTFLRLMSNGRSIVEKECNEKNQLKYKIPVPYDRKVIHIFNIAVPIAGKFNH